MPSSEICHTWTVWYLNTSIIFTVYEKHGLLVHLFIGRDLCSALALWKSQKNWELSSCYGRKEELESVMLFIGTFFFLFFSFSCVCVCAYSSCRCFIGKRLEEAKPIPEDEQALWQGSYGLGDPCWHCMLNGWRKFTYFLYPVRKELKCG